MDIKKYREFSNMKVTDLYTNDGAWYCVGTGYVSNIYEHEAQGEGDKWFYIVEYSLPFENNVEQKRVDYIFNASKVTKK